MAARLKEKYEKEVVPALVTKFGYKNKMQVPGLSKIVINIGLGRAVNEPKIVDYAAGELGKITGQKPVLTKAKKAISNFKLRKGLPIGCMVTLRKNQMYEFFDRLCNIGLPRVRDFRGVSVKAFDDRGNYTLGLKEHSIFPEVDLDKVDSTMGMNITFVTTADSKDEGMELLSLLGMPFRKR
ncbi:MAG: 50S ribosomal protein L5 [Bdellovibrionales bacterium]|nr:50S ribosomal protein L5 [Bdellovibrionales bacterium]